MNPAPNTSPVPAAKERNLRLFLDLTTRKLRSQVLSAGAGWFWLLVTPIALLAVYSFVFGVIFQARVPDLDVPFAAWLAVALWPWLAFADGVLKGSSAIHGHSELISKVAIPRVLFTLSTHAAAFVLQLSGYLVVLLALVFIGVDLTLSGLPYLILILASLYVLSAGLALVTSAVQVYVRDLEQLLPTLMMFWFFLTPILYAPEMLPAEMRGWLQLNPMAWWMEEIRSVLFYGKTLPDQQFLILLAGALLSLACGKWIFDRLSPHFEDFL